MNKQDVIEILKRHRLKVTPQRIAVLDAALSLKNHPGAESIAEYIKSNDPNIARGTIYKTLETFEERGIIEKVKTDCDKMRYDVVQEKHHHLYSSDSGRIEDYYDDDLDMMIDNYFTKKGILQFKIESIRLHITGKFINT